MGLDNHALEATLMPEFGRTSRRKLNTCDQRLQDICNEAIQHIDFSVICGFRCEAEQNAAYNGGKSQVDWPNSKHNSTPSPAMDIIPFPVDWNATDRFIELSKVIKAVADRQGTKIKWGGDWSWFDGPHYEIEER